MDPQPINGQAVEAACAVLAQAVFLTESSRRDVLMQLVSGLITLQLKELELSGAIHPAAPMPMTVQ